MVRALTYAYVRVPGSSHNKPADSFPVAVVRVDYLFTCMHVFVERTHTRTYMRPTVMITDTHTYLLSEFHVSTYVCVQLLLLLLLSHCYRKPHQHWSIVHAGKQKI